MMLMQTPEVDVGELVLHHSADAYTIGFEPFWSYSWQRWPDTHLGPLTVNLTPTKHVVFLTLAAALVFLVMWSAGKSLERQKAHQQAPKGFANAIEALVLFVRNDIAIANIGPAGAKFAPFIMSLFFLILFANLLGLVPWGAAPMSNLAVTGALALLVMAAVEIGGLVKLGPKGYWHTICPSIPGMHGPGAVAISIAMIPIEIMSKLVKPFALAVRLFGNMVAGHFVILSLFGIIFLFGHLVVWNWAIGVVTAALMVAIMALELFVAVLQAYVFVLLSAVFIGLMQHEH